MPFELIVAMRFLREGRMQSILIIVGVTVGVAVIIFITALITGLQGNIITRTLGTQAHIVVRPPEEVNRLVLRREDADIAARIEKRAQRLRSIDQWQSVLELVEHARGVVAASPTVAGAAFASRGNANKSVALLGVDPVRYLRIVKVHESIVAGEFRVSGTDAVIGIELASDLGISVGDKLRLTTAEGGNDVVTITGIFDLGNKEVNRRWVFVTLKMAQNLLDLAGGVTNIDLAVQEIFSAETVAGTLSNQTGLLVESWMQTNAQLLAALRNQTITTVIIRIFVILIVALGIASVLVVSVVQKSREIGILRAMGTSSRKVMAVFLLQGAIVGFLGSLLGSLLAGALLVAFPRIFRDAGGFPFFEPDVNIWLFVTAMLVAVLTGIVAAVTPARRAAHMDPVSAIRYG